MRRKALFLLLFLVAGLLSAVLFIIILCSAPSLIWWAAGALFAVAFLGAVATARSVRGIRYSAKPGALLLTALMLAVAYPIAVFMIVLIAGYLGEGKHPLAEASILPCMAAVCGLVVALALRVCTGRWDVFVTALLVLSGVGSALLALGMQRAGLVRDPVVSLFPVGEPAIGCLCGYWLLRAERTVSRE